MLSALVLSTAIALGGWGPLGCSRSESQVQVEPVDSGYEWRLQNGNYYLFRGGRQTGGYDPANDFFRSYDAASQLWGPPQDPPWGKRAKLPETKEEPAVAQNFGMDWKPGSAERFAINGVEAKRQQAMKAIEGGGELSDDSNRPFLTVIGSKDDCSRISKDFTSAPELAPFKDKVRVQCYQPDNWALKDRDGRQMYESGNPAIYYQTAKGKVLHHQNDYDGPATLAIALRKADPTYDPKTDPDLRKQPLIPDNIPWTWLGLGAFVLLLLKR